MTSNEQAAPAHRVTWFEPERPVENGTVYVRPEPDAAVTPSGNDAASAAPERTEGQH